MLHLDVSLITQCLSVQKCYNSHPYDCKFIIQFNRLFVSLVKPACLFRNYSEINKFCNHVIGFVDHNIGPLEKAYAYTRKYNARERKNFLEH